MARVKGPNGLTLNMPDATAKRLVDSPSGDYEYVKDEPKSETKSTAKKSSSSKK